MSAASAADERAVLAMLTDAHAHPQLDPAHLEATIALRIASLAAMSVSHDVDWPLTLRLRQLTRAARCDSSTGGRPLALIPGFGVHPWWAHLHATAEGDAWHQLLEAPSAEQLHAACAILAAADPVTNSGAYATNRPDPPPQPPGAASQLQAQQQQAQQQQAQQQEQQAQQPAAFAGIHVAGEQQRQQQQCESDRGPCLGSGLRVVPQAEWQAELRRLLAAVPEAIVGEVGIDRAACIPGSRARTKLAHQLALLEAQVGIAAEFGRPVSVHCVRSYGHLLQLFSRLAAQPGRVPPQVMLHSYGGSVEEIPRFTRLPGIGGRFWFSFSAAINTRSPDKLAARIAAVPEDRLLIESDQVTPAVIDDSMLSIARVVARVKGWRLEQAAQRLAANHRAFYADQLAAIEAAEAGTWG